MFASSRPNPRVELLGLLPRPPYIDGIAFSVHVVGVAGAPGDGISPGSDSRERDCSLEPQLVDRWGERGSYVGQELLVPGPDGCEPSPSVAWSADGTAVALVEQRWKRLTPPGEDQPARLTLARLVGRRPIDPAPAVVAPVATPEPVWAIRYEDYLIPRCERRDGHSRQGVRQRDAAQRPPRRGVRRERSRMRRLLRRRRARPRWRRAPLDPAPAVGGDLRGRPRALRGARGFLARSDPTSTPTSTPASSRPSSTAGASGARRPARRPASSRPSRRSRPRRRRTGAPRGTRT